ncbi:MAG: response regulator [Candidatus Omnitrophica bacterium]|nr:response regulator [Candidatus Omnitrophota bacterium]
MKQEKPLSARQAASYCQVNLKTALKWIDEGKLKAYQLPDSGVNRILLPDLLDFMKRFGLPIPAEINLSGATRLLVVDDELPAINTLKRIFRSHDLVLEEAHDGFEAGRKVETFKPDIILLDLQMPGMSGRDVLMKIKQNPATRHIKVIILSGYVDMEAKNRLLKDGACGVLEKPIDRKILFSLIGLTTTCRKDDNT